MRTGENGGTSGRSTLIALRPEAAMEREKSNRCGIALDPEATSIVFFKRQELVSYDVVIAISLA